MVGAECMFTWYWLADLCAREGIAFVLGHALYMKAIHGGKAKNVVYETRVPAQTGTGTMQFTIDTSPIIFYLTTVTAKYHVLLVRVKNDTAAPLVLSKDQDTVEFTFANGVRVSVAVASDHASWCPRWRRRATGGRVGSSRDHLWCPNRT